MITVYEVLQISALVRDCVYRLSFHTYIYNTHSRSSPLFIRAAIILPVYAISQILNCFNPTTLFFTAYFEMVARIMVID